MNSSFPLSSWVKAQLSKAGRSVHPAPPSMWPPACDHLLATPGQSTPGQSRLLTLPSSEVCRLGEGQGEIKGLGNWVKDGPLWSWVSTVFN